MQGIVKERAETQEGAKYITIDHQRYYFDRGIDQSPEVGAKIEFQYHEFGEARGKYGKPRSISQWSPVLYASGKAETGSPISDVDILRSVSNLVGNACAAGTIKEAEDLEKWCLAARMGLSRAMERDAPQREPAREPRADDDRDDWRRNPGNF